MRLYLLLFLSVVNGGTSTYRPLEYLPCELIKMDAFCQEKDLFQIPPNLYPTIEKLDLSRNQLQRVAERPLTFYTAVQHLDLSSNKISFIYSGVFANMTSLNILNLSNNQLDQFVQQSKPGIGLIPQVKILDLSGNSLYNGMAEHFIEKAPSLTHLSLASNSITTISAKMFIGSPSLTDLDLHNNIIMDIEEGAFENLPHLFKLDLSMNSLTCISGYNLQQLHILDLSKNSIETFHTTESEEEYNLEELDLSENKLMDFPVLPKKNWLISLNVSKNLIQLGSESSPDDINYLEEDWLKDSFQILNQTPKTTVKNASSVNLSKLVYLDLSYNEIKSIPDGFFDTMSSLHFLNLSKNCLQTYVVTSNYALTSLVTLDLSYNVLQNLSIAINTLTSLQTFYLQSNFLQALEFDIFQGLPNIKELNLQSNNIKVCSTYSGVAKQRIGKDDNGCVSLFSISTLQYLDLSDNMMKNLPEYAFHKTPLTMLDLSLNQGLKVKAQALSGLESFLEYLHLDGNGLSTLNVDLPHFVHLKHLSLSHNQLTWLPTWNKDCTLQILDLRNNSFSDLQTSDITALEKTLKKLYLSGNPLSCCGNIWLSHMIQKGLVDIPDLEVMSCQYSKTFAYQEDILISHIRPEVCEKENLKKMNIFIVLAFVLILSIIVIGLFSFCCFRRQKFRQQFKA
ncbi:transforming growth factor beta activator LRRC32 [Microcaecilia unicolor]|uniref:Transforming growth factor beta activator LRRC32 n=1 Tax=Microcaecilia unicolor TaxID=1415580 RepID=A0A6P7XS67_9AMPH|nr:transforming growth factor beta activator LRRC32 [Microcaecilia unicolor]XP_030055916.1 transforming growth factor beta activator LRRC32 [Microcaecilia unicolor]XP_030055918.1 transforming growth factor beta activator LRRC32 [Microcaecilia unicolor]